MSNMVIALKACIFNEGRLLLVKRVSNDKVGGGTWETAGGKLDFGETLEEALIREVQEETSLLIKPRDLLYATTFFTDPSRQMVMLVYLANVQEGTVSLSDEHTDYIWATKEETRSLLPSSILKDFEQNNIFSLSEWMD